VSHRLLAYATFLVAVIGTHFSTVAALVARARESNTESHVLLVPLVSVVLLGRRWGAIAASSKTEPVDLLIGLPLVAGGALLVWIAGSLSTAVSGMLIMMTAGFLVCFGHTALRAATFPLAFLGFAIPFPAPVLEWAVQVLKDGSAEAVAALFTVADVPFHRREYVFSLPSFTIEIADECSGIRSSIALLLTMVLAGHTCLARSWSRVVLVALILPAAILKNGLRIVALSLLAMYVDPGFLIGELHHEGGIVFFVLSLAMLMPVLPVLRRLEAKLQPHS